MKNFTTLLMLLLSLITFGQTGGEHAFPFLSIDYNARTAALGRHYLAGPDNDVNMGVFNPAVLNSEMHNTIGFNQALHAGGINHGMVAYARNIKDHGTGSVHMRYVAYGEMDRTNVQGDVIGTFSAGDFVLGAGFGKELNPRIRVGGNVSFIWSQLESFSSTGMSIDLSGNYVSESERTVVTAIVRNAGVQFTRYHNLQEERAPLPTNPMISLSHKLKHAPFRFGIVAHHLNQWDLTYQNPNLQPTTDPLTGDVIPVPTAGFGEKLARHFLFQLEVLAGDVLSIRAAFDYNRRRSFLVPNRPGMAGFSAGVGLQFKRFSVDYGLVIFSSAGFNNLITLTTNFDKWKRKG